MTPTSTPNLTPEQAAELLKRMLPGSADPFATAQPPRPMSGAVSPSEPLGRPMQGVEPEPAVSSVYGDTPRPLGRPEPQIMNLDNSSAAAALMMAPPGVRAAGAIARPALAVGKRLLTASPMATAAATGATAAALPSATGRTPWEVMQGNWDQRRQDLQARVAAEQQAIAEAEKASLAARPKAPRATSNVNRGANALALHEAAMKQHTGALESQLEPRRAGITDLQGQLAGLDEEIKQSQLPIREKHPMVGALAPPLAWAAAALSGGKLGKFTRGLQENRAAKITGAAERGSTELARGRSAFAGPQGRATAAELQSVEGQGAAPLLAPAAAGTAGGLVGAAEGALAPLGLSAIDAISAPGGSPLGLSAAEAPYTQQFWMQAAPEMAVAGGASSLAALLAALKKPGTGLAGIGAKFGPPSVPTEQVRGMAAAARSSPKTQPKNKKDD